MNPKTKLGLVGCGRAAELIYLPALKYFSNIEVTGVVDPLNERSTIISKIFKHCRQYSSVNSEFLDQIDAAIIITPPETHIKLASELLNRNKYVLVEKPLALTFDGISELAKIESASIASLMMAFNHRYWEPAKKVKEALKNKSKIYSAEIVFTGNYKLWNPVSFKSDPINDLGPHVFDLIKFIFNEKILSITAKLIGNNSVDLIIKMTGNFFIHCHVAHSNTTEKTIKVISENGTYYIFKDSERVLPEPGAKRKALDSLDKIKRKINGKISPLKKTYITQLNTFLELIKSKTSSVPGINEGVSAIKAVEAVFKSLNQSGKEIFLDEIQ